MTGLIVSTIALMLLLFTVVFDLRSADDKCGLRAIMAKKRDVEPSPARHPPAEEMGHARRFNLWMVLPGAESADKAPDLDQAAITDHLLEDIYVHLSRIGRDPYRD